MPEGVDDNYQLQPGYVAAWAYLSDQPTITPELVDRLQGLAAALMLDDQRRDYTALHDRIASTVLPIPLIAILAAVARRLGEIAYGTDQLNQILTNWKPGDTFEHAQDW